MQKWAQVAEESGSMGTPESSMPSDASATEVLLVAGAC